MVLGWPTITTERRGPRGQAAADAIRSVRRAGTLVVLTALPQPVLPHGMDAQDASRAVQSLQAPAFRRGSSGFASERKVQPVLG